MKTKLKPCPFCGSASIYISEKLHPLYIISCNGCEVQTDIHNPKEDAIKAWNTRAKEEK